MSIVHGQPDAQGPGHPASQSPPPGPGFPAGAGAPLGADGGYGGYGGLGGRRRRPRHLLAGIVAAGIAFAAGAGGTAWAVGLPGSALGGALTGHRALSTASIVRMTDPAVVNVVSTLGVQGAASAGTGIVLSSSGEVLTNNHVIDGATSIRVTDVGNGRTYPATVAGYDATHDIAVLKLSGASGLKTATIGDSGSVRVGQKIVALGNAGGRGGSPKVAAGHITGLGKSITAQDEGSGAAEQLTGVIRTNANIQPGDSGGPLLNTSGQVVGINTAASTSEARSSTGSVQAFAIPISRAVSIANQIEAGTASATVHIGATAFLGVAVSSQGSGQPGVPGSTAGAVVAQVVPGGAAASAGIAAGDAIVSLGGRAITSPTDLRNALTSIHPGNSVPITWVDQSGQTQSANVVLGSGPAA